MPPCRCAFRAYPSDPLDDATSALIDDAFPSSFEKGRKTGGSRSRTTSEGRHRRVPSGVSTNGRLIRIGWASIASSSCASGSAALSKPNAPFSKSNSASGVPSGQRLTRCQAGCRTVLRPLMGLLRILLVWKHPMSADPAGPGVLRVEERGPLFTPSRIAGQPIQQQQPLRTRRGAQVKSPIAPRPCNSAKPCGVRASPTAGTSAAVHRR